MDHGIKLRNDIQALRAVAVLGVILFHFNKNWLPGGFIGVDVFFVMSGFLITHIVLQKKAVGAFSVFDFYVGRACRIFPAYFVLLIVVSLCMALLLIPRDFELFRDSAVSALYFNANSFFALQNDYFAPAGYELPLLHAWSLAVEMQFYLLLPLGLVFLPSRLLMPTALAVIALFLAFSEYRLRQGHQQEMYFSLLARVPEFLIGGVAATWSIRRSISQVSSTVFACSGVILLCCSFFFITENQRFPGLMALPACIGTALILISPKSSFNNAISCRPLIFLGALSYSLYLWHWPILASIRYYSGTYELQGGSALVFVALTLGSAYLSYRFVESPFRGRFSIKPVIARLVGLGALTVSAILLAGIVNPRLVEPLPSDLTRYADSSVICHGKIVGDCILGEREASRTIMMLGDSHAAQLNAFADVVGKALHAKIRVISASGCVNIPGFDVDRIAEWARTACLNQIAEAEKFVPQADGLILAGMWQLHSTSENFMSQLDYFISRTAERKQPVLVLAQVPMLSSDPQRIYRASSMGLHLPVSVNPEWAGANAKVKERVSKYPNVTFLDLSDNPFFSDAPLQDHTLIYQDTNHLNKVGSQRYGEMAVPFLEKFMTHVDVSKEATADFASTPR